MEMTCTHATKQYRSTGSYNEKCLLLVCFFLSHKKRERIRVEAREEEITVKNIYV